MAVKTTRIAQSFGRMSMKGQRACWRRQARAGGRVGMRGRSDEQWSTGGQWPLSCS